MYSQAQAHSSQPESGAVASAQPKAASRRPSEEEATKALLKNQIEGQIFQVDELIRIAQAEAFDPKNPDRDAKLAKLAELRNKRDELADNLKDLERSEPNQLAKKPYAAAFFAPAEDVDVDDEPRPAPKAEVKEERSPADILLIDKLKKMIKQNETEKKVNFEARVNVLNAAIQAIEQDDVGIFALAKQNNPNYDVFYGLTGVVPFHLEDPSDSTRKKYALAVGNENQPAFPMHKLLDEVINSFWVPRNRAVSAAAEAAVEAPAEAAPELPKQHEALIAKIKETIEEIKTMKGFTHEMEMLLWAIIPDLRQNDLTMFNETVKEHRAGTQVYGVTGLPIPGNGFRYTVSQVFHTVKNENQPGFKVREMVATVEEAIRMALFLRENPVEVVSASGSAPGASH